ncbi:DUF2336 domain-containing protein [Rhizorhabdus dicambivorans]|uniref:DUF2336 domain-containing protein n=1 Tax=Rhizorhabdus dicambivorans TaxID=1850238 RepID=A0A2A4FWR5_9SPHN|nr:DUF2336 domain-containing protein [Rhizorhabdus dicambivorans]ATE63059.1 DUF2336 domain-containing protein [Rhizorhabdus dicambivorans]PCE43236.1 DUF2336 domain-containing protein [Rhizorhabdus dicambivorans]
MMGLEDERQSWGQPAAGTARWLSDAARALDSVDHRVDRAASDLFHDAAIALSDQHRAQIGQLLRAMIGAIEDELRLRVADALGDERPELVAALGSAGVAIALPLLERTHLLREPGLVAAMLRRVDEHRLAVMLGRDSPYHVADLAQRLLDLGDADIAAATMALLIAESRRYDQFGDPALARTDLPLAPHRQLLWAVAAALRHYLVRQHALPDSRADLLLAGAVGALLAEHDEADTLEGRAAALAGLLGARGLLDDKLLADALEEGWLALFTAAVAQRAGIDPPGVWSMIADPTGMMLGTVLRAIDCAREAAVTMLWRIGSAEGAEEDVIVARAEAFDALDQREAAEAVLIWRLDPNYRRAVIEIGEGGRRR